jgi:hypothetical protein
MTDRGPLLPTLDRLFAGPRESILTLDEFVSGLEGRSYAFMIAALDLPNCVPTGIPLLSTVTGVPMLLLMAQGYLGRPTPDLPRWAGTRGLPRGKLQDFLIRARPYFERLERAVKPRRQWWIRGTARRVLQFTWLLLIIVLALPIPFDNFLPAWAIQFFCLALIERDGVMAMLGWVFTALTTAWTIFLMIVGPYTVLQIVKSVF